MYTRTNVMLNLNSEEGSEYVRFFNRIYKHQSEQSILCALRDYKKLRESGKGRLVNADLKSYKKELIGKKLLISAYTMGFIKCSMQIEDVERRGNCYVLVGIAHIEEDFKQRDEKVSIRLTGKRGLSSREHIEELIEVQMSAGYIEIKNSTGHIKETLCLCFIAREE